MNEILKKIAVLALSFALLASVAGCGENDTAPTKTVKLVYTMAGPGMQQDSAKVFKEFNARLQEYIPGLEIDFKVIPLADYTQQFMLMQTSREQLDIANTYGLTIATEVKNGTFLKLDDLLDEYGQDVRKELPDWLWKFGKVNGDIYQIPSYQMLSVGYGLRFFKDQAEKYLDIEGLKKELRENSTFTDRYYDILEDYLAKLNANGELGKGYAAGGYILKGYEKILDYYVIKHDDPNAKIQQFFETEDAKCEFDRMAEWYKKGYIREDVSSANDYDRMLGKRDGYVVSTDIIGYRQEEIDAEKYNDEFLDIPFEDYYYIPSVNAAAGTGIVAATEHPDLCMKFLNLMQTKQGKDLLNLIIYGIEDDHYTKIGDDKIKTEYTGQGGSNDRYGLYNWILGNTLLAYDTQSDRVGFKEWVFNEVNVSDKRSVLMGFVPDTEKISSKMAQINTVKTEFRGGLATGCLPNHEQRYAEFVEKMNKAGNQDIINELQSQIDLFLANK